MILWRCVNSCAEIVLHSLTFSQADHEVEKEVEKNFEKSLAVFLDSIEKIQDLLIEGKESNVEKEGQEVVGTFDRYLYLNSSSSSSIKVVKESVKENSQLILSPQWLKLVSLTVRTVLSWCSLLLLTECENGSALLNSVSPPGSLPLSSSHPKLPPSLTITAGAVSVDAAVCVPEPVCVSVHVPVCVKDGMWRARQLLILLIGTKSTHSHTSKAAHVF